MGLGAGDDGSELRCTWDTQECPEGTAQMQGRDGDVGVGALPFLFCTFPSSLCSCERQFQLPSTDNLG